MDVELTTPKNSLKDTYLGKELKKTFYSSLFCKIPLGTKWEQTEIPF